MISKFINYEWLKEADLRFDSSYHLSEGRLARKIIESSPYEVKELYKLSEKIFLGEIFKRTFVPSSQTGYAYISGSDILKLELQDGKFISKKFTKQTNDLMLKQGWILLTCSGTIGNVVLTNSDFDGRIGTHDLIRIVPNKKEIEPGYLYSFLASRYGRALLIQKNYGGVVKHIEPNHIKDIPVPKFPDLLQKKINYLIIGASNARVEANKLLDEAKKKFEKLNGLQYSNELLCASENAIRIGFYVNSSPKLRTSIKARNYSFRVQKILEIWNSKPGKKFEKMISEDGLTRGQGGFFKRIVDTKVKGIDIISQSDIHEIKPKFKKIIKINIKNTEIAKRGMIILPAAGTLGENEIFVRPLLVYKNYEGKVLSEVVGKMECSCLTDAAYLFLALSTTAGFRILRAMVYGKNLLYPNWNLLKDINIPCKNNKIKNLIAELVLCAYDHRAKADKKEELAIKIIENEILSWQK